MTSQELLRDALNTLSFSYERDDMPLVLAQVVAALVQLACANGNSRDEIHQAIDHAWNEVKAIRSEMQ